MNLRLSHIFVAMFESNSDFDIDEGIFGAPFESDCVTPTKNQLDTSKPEDLNKISSKSLLLKQNNFNLVQKNESEAVCSATKTNIKFAKPLDVSSIKTVVPRKFPGPAGLLPDRKDVFVDIKTVEENNTKVKQQIEVDVCSQSTVNSFKNGIWNRVAQDFHSSIYPFLPDKYNITWIKAKAKTNKLINQKAPFLAAVIQNIQCLKLKTAIIKIVLKDPTGSIPGMIVHDLYEEYMNELVEGSVIILKQFGVLSTDGSKNYITITTNNLIAIYSEDKVDNSVKINKLQQISIGDILRNIEEVKSKHNLALMDQKLNPVLKYPVHNLNSSPSMYNNRINHENNIHSESDNQTRFVVPNLRNLYSESRSPSANNSIKSRYSNVPVERNLSFSNPKISSNTQFSSKLIQDNLGRFPGSMENIVNLNKSEASPVKKDTVENEILTSIFEGVDTDSLFDDF